VEIDKHIREMVKAVDEAIIKMLERNGFIVGDITNNMNMVMLMDDIKRKGYSLKSTTDGYELLKDNERVDIVKVSFVGIIEPTEISKTGGNVQLGGVKNEI
jgi:hypothetical protein